VANDFYGETVTYDPTTGDWATATLKNVGNEDEASAIKLSDDSVLVVDNGNTSSERFIPSQNAWVNDGTTPVDLFSNPGGELGAGFLLPNGNAIMLGAVPSTAVYTPSGNTNPGTWGPGPNIPNNLSAPDAPAAMMNNGKILCTFSQNPYRLDGTNYVFNSPTYFYEYDYSAGSTGAFTQVHAPNGSYTDGGATYTCRMLDLPDGTVLFTDGGSQLYVYKPLGAQLAAGRPNIQSVSWNADGSLHISGTLFNGITEGAAYGDDAQMATDYPLVRFTDGSGNVYYGTTYNWSSTSVMTGNRVVTTECTLPAGVLNEPGAFSLQVVANGNASSPVTFYGPVWVDVNNYNSEFQFGDFTFPYGSLPPAVSDVQSGGTVAFDASIQPSTAVVNVPYTISTPMTIISAYGPTTIGQ
jgi:hypothetical protein